MIKGTIYKITCLIDGLCYIGQTFQSVEARWNDHIKGWGSKALYDAIQEHGIEMFKFETLHQGITCRDVLNSLEIALIAAHNAYTEGYNEHRGGQDEYRCSQAWEHADEICRLYDEERMSLRELAEQYNASHSTIQAILRVNDIECRNKSYAWEHSQEICHLYTKRSKTLVQIAEMYDVSERLIAGILEVNEINRKPASRHKKHRTWQHSKEICRLYTKDLLSYQKIAERFSTNPIQIRRILLECGVKMRKYSPRKSPNEYQLRMDFE